MIDVTDRHCRFFHRLLAPRALLYTEMITTGALLHGDAGRHLEYDAAEHPVALQLGGSEPDALARAARLGEQAGYDEINLNCGCPSERVQQGAFGACLMAEPQLVADCIQAMREVVQVPVTVKHRLGLDDEQSYGFVRDFVGVQYEAGCRVFVVHARNAVLKGLSPKENRQIPPLRYAFARQLKQDFPDCVIVLNGGLATAEQAEAEGQGLDGVMLGRAAWHQPEVLRELSQRFWPGDASLDDTDVLQRYAAYTERMVAQGVPMRILVRPLLGWGNGRKGARRWRQMLSDHRLLGQEDPGLLLRAWEQVA
ncbi:tRNA-dihydrouridine synthase A [Kerstersia gyiorum]|uniref:tRNA-dihydrouridine(20/20a) synthase n=2 Tax=Kerstersia gyiorum TaxID=206506 RepID=A0A171KV60_9BURK|nr:tRNA-dihydrouridine synthase A [Kerstersia gyiorum]